MEMCYDGALVMPSNYAVMDEDEMIYVEGGRTTSCVKTAAQAYNYCVSTAWSLRLMAGITGCTVAVVASWIGNISGIIIGVAGGLWVGSFVWGWSSAYSSGADQAKSIKKKYGKNKKVKITESVNVCLDATVKVVAV